MSKKTLILGAGFAGISALRKFKKYNVTIIDQNKNHEFLPLLPDILSGNIKSKTIQYPISKITKKYNADFINDKIEKIDFKNQKVYLKNQSLTYDFLLISTGCKTNFYQQKNIENHSFKLDNTKDAIKILDLIKNNPNSNIIISGAGYTGIEIAANIYRNSKKITLIDPSDSILPALPKWLQNKIYKLLISKNIVIKNNVHITNIKNKTVTLSTGEFIENAYVIWTAGVITDDFVNNFCKEKTPQSRILVNEYLQSEQYKNVFFAGDAALYKYKGQFLRLAVQFSIQEGKIAAKNIKNSIKNKNLQKYTPFDKGYVLPLTQFREGYGKIFNITVKNIFPILMHYILCIIYLKGLKNKIKIFLFFLKYLLSGFLSYNKGQ